MYSSQYDTHSAFNGGGFTSSQSTQSTDRGSSSAKRGRDRYELVPVTVKQINEASVSGDDKSNFVISGVDVASVTLIGMVSKMAERVTNVSFTIDDGTGQIECNRWINEAFDTREMEDIQDGINVRVNGHVKSINGRKLLVAFSVSGEEKGVHVTELSQKLEISMEHIIESIRTLEKEGLIYATIDELDFKSTPSVEGRNRLRQMVLDYLQQPSNFGGAKGVHVNELSQKLKIPMEKIIESIRTLEKEGLIDATIDEFHFKSTPSVEGRNRLRQMVLDYLQQPSNFGGEKGVHVNELSQELEIPMEKIIESIRTLEDEGLIYVTIDEFHFKSTPSVEGRNRLREMVLDYLHQPSNFGREKGVHVNELSQKLEIPMEKITETIRTLEKKGLIYATIDKFHFKSTTSIGGLNKFEEMVLDYLPPNFGEGKGVDMNELSQKLNIPVEKITECIRTLEEEGLINATIDKFYVKSTTSVEGLNRLDQMVLDYLMQHSNFGGGKGIHRDELSQKLAIPVEKIIESIRTLEKEGLIYDTIDELHFKSINSGEGLSGLDQMVFDYLSQHSNFGGGKGVHRDELSQKIKIPLEKINESIRTLEEQGLIYHICHN